MRCRILLTVALLALACGSRLTAADKINVVLIVADDLGWRDLGCYGSTFYRTPHIDRLAKDGIRFTDFYAACPVCSPTRASILTGRYPVRTRVTDWIPGRPSDPRGPITTPRTATELALAETILAVQHIPPQVFTAREVNDWAFQVFALVLNPDHWQEQPNYRHFWGVIEQAGA